MSEPVRAWQHTVTPPDAVTMTIEEGDPDRIVVYSETDAGPEPETMRDAVRGAAWGVMGIPRNPEASLYKYAKNERLGAPLTAEFDFEYSGTLYRGQGYAMGIAYCEVGVWVPVRMAWW